MTDADDERTAAVILVAIALVAIVATCVGRDCDTTTGEVTARER